MEPSARTDRDLSGQESVKQESQQSISLGERTMELIHCEKDDYELMLDITRKMAEEILRQTGLEIAFAQGESVRKDFSLGRGNFGVFRVGHAKKGGHYVGIKVTQGDEAAEAEIRIQATLSGFAHIMPSVDYCKVVKVTDQLKKRVATGQTKSKKKSAHLTVNITRKALVQNG